MRVSAVVKRGGSKAAGGTRRAGTPRAQASRRLRCRVRGACSWPQDIRSSRYKVVSTPRAAAHSVACADICLVSRVELSDMRRDGDRRRPEWVPVGLRTRGARLDLSCFIHPTATPPAPDPCPSCANLARMGCRVLTRLVVGGHRTCDVTLTGRGYGSCEDGQLSLTSGEAKARPRFVPGLLLRRDGGKSKKTRGETYFFSQ